ncbi:MAG: hypothetical protein ACK4VN_03175 [Bacteroidales bacterium]
MKKASFIFLFLLLILVGCPTEEVPAPDFQIYVINNSEATAVYTFINTRNKNDTVLWESMPWGNINDWTLESGEVRILNAFSGDVKRTLENYHIHYYSFYADTISAFPWNVIRDEYKVAKRVTISSWEEYEAMDFTVEFP